MILRARRLTDWWRTRPATLRWSATVLLFILLSLVALRLLTRWQWLPVGVWATALLLLAATFLVIGLGGLLSGLNILARRPQSATLSLLILLGTSYLLPVLLLIGLVLLLRQPTENLFMRQTQQELLQKILPAPLLFGQPWLFLWQSFFLAGLGLALPRQQAVRATLSGCLNGLLLGLGVGLAGLFFYSFLSTLPGWDGLSGLSLSAPIWLLQVLCAVLILPWASERIFRGVLWQTLRARMSERSALWLGAALYAIVQFRPLVWLPAFALGLALTLLTVRQAQSEPDNKQPSLLPATLAHGVANLIFLIASVYLPI